MAQSYNISNGVLFYAFVISKTNSVMKHYVDVHLHSGQQCVILFCT